MTEDEAKPYAKPIPNWIPETRTVIVTWMMFSSFMIIVLCWWRPPSGVDSQLLNMLIGMYVGTGFITSITWWMGDAKGSDSTNKMQDKMADALAPNGKSVAPVVVVSWWSLMTDAEKAAITEKAKTDAKIQSIIALLTAGKAEPEHVAALVAAGLLTDERAKVFKTS